MTHRELYPEQYTHALIGQSVTVHINGKTLAQGIVERVLPTRYGLLAGIAGDKSGKFWAIKDCKAN